jgi:hypothetical protein
MRQNVTARVIFLILPKLLIYRLLHLLFYVHYSKFSCSCQAENVKAALESLGSRASRRAYNRLQRTAQLFENALEGGGQISMNVQTTITL